MRRLVVGVVALVLAPLMVAGAVLAVTALLDEVFGSHLNPFDIRGIGLLDWLAGGPGAGPTSFQNYATFMLGGMAAAIPFAIISALWVWASKTEGEHEQRKLKREQEAKIEAKYRREKEERAQQQRREVGQAKKASVSKEERKQLEAAGEMWPQQVGYYQVWSRRSPTRAYRLAPDDGRYGPDLVERERIAAPFFRARGAWFFSGGGNVSLLMTLSEWNQTQQKARERVIPPSRPVRMSPESAQPGPGSAGQSLGRS